jgi:hypothetical protein
MRRGAFNIIASIGLVAGLSLVLTVLPTRPANATCEFESCEGTTTPTPTYTPPPTYSSPTPTSTPTGTGEGSSSPTPTPTPTPSQSPTPTPSPSPSPSPTPTPTPLTDGGTSGSSINGLADQRFNQMITNRVLGSVLLGVNEQINCSDCVSAFGSVGSFTAGVHGRKELTNNLALLAGLAYTQYGENGYHVTSAPIGAFALRYDFVDWGSSRPFFDIGTVVSPFQKVRYSRSYVTSLGAVSLDSSTNSSNYAVYGRGGGGGRPAPPPPGAAGRRDQPPVTARRGRSLDRGLAALATRVRL